MQQGIIGKRRSSLICYYRALDAREVDPSAETKSRQLIASKDRSRKKARVLVADTANYLSPVIRGLLEEAKVRDLFKLEVTA